MSRISISAVTEASGICPSVLHADTYYVHNDSGSKPLLFAINGAGRDAGYILAPGRYGAADAEDCASAVVRGEPLLMICDVGDNGCKRASYKMLVMRELEARPVGRVALDPVHVFTWMYPDGKRRNCEACALLPSGVILVVTKSWPAKSGPTTLFTIRGPVSGDGPGVVVDRVKVLPSSYGIITGMDAMGDKVVLLGIVRGQGVATVLDGATFDKLGAVKVPPARQREGICFSHDGTSVLVVSEGDRALTATVLPAALRPAPAPSPI
jgi:hypothetical protein